MYAAGGGENWAKVSKNTTTHFSVFLKWGGMGSKIDKGDQLYSDQWILNLWW